MPPRFRGNLIPPALIVARFFGDEQAQVDRLNLAAEEATRGAEEFVEEHAVEDGLLADAVDDDKVNKALVAARLKAAKREDAEREEIEALQRMLALYDAEATAKKAAKDAQAALELATLKKFGELTMPEIKQLVLDDKWHATIATRVASEVTALTLALVERIRELGARYAETVGSLDAELHELESRVVRHLSAMGVFE